MAQPNPSSNFDVFELDYYASDSYTNKKFTDLIVRCRDKEFHVHKVIMAAHSGFFCKACDPESPWVEARSGVINLDEDHPKIVETMLDYCYMGEDCTFLSPYSDTGCIGDTSAEGEVRFYVQLHAVADKYRIMGLKTKTFERFRVLIDCDVLDAHYDADSTEPITPAGVGRIIREIFDTTLDTDNLRRYFLAQVSLRIDVLLRSSRFTTEVNGIDGFWKQLVEVNAEAGHRARTCPSCKITYEQDFRNRYWDKDDDYKCTKCGQYDSIRAWTFQSPSSSYELAPDTDTEEEKAAGGSPKKRK